MALFDSSNIDKLNQSGASDSLDPATVGSTVKEVIGSALSTYIIPIAAFVIIGFGIYGSILYFTAYGSEEKAAKGKTTIIWAVIGALVVGAAWLIVNWWVGGLGAFQYTNQLRNEL